MNLQVDLLDNPLTTCPGQTGCQKPIEMYLNRHFGCIDDKDRQFRKGLVPTQIRTRSAGPELLPTLITAYAYLESLWYASASAHLEGGK